MIIFQTEPIIRQIIMGYKHTFEIITKDIQDIEKLVGNFENYSEIPNIELDLALSKLRNVYEILLMFRNGDSITASTVPPSPAQQKERQAEEPEAKPEKPAEAVKTTGADTKPAEQSEPVKPAGQTEQERKEEKTQTEAQQPKPAKSASEHEKKILAEKLLNQTAHINEKLGEHARKQDISSRLLSSPITSISGSMGINDKFFFIRELFNGDAGKFRATMDSLDHASNFDEAYNYLSDNFEWNMESADVQQLLSLVRRKFTHS